jgi:mycothiol synthase
LLSGGWILNGNRDVGDSVDVITRPYADEADYERIREMLIESFALSAPPDYCTIGDLDWWRFTDSDPKSIQKAQLWLSADRVLAIAWPSGSQLDILIHPQHVTLTDSILDWAESRPGDDGEHRSWTITSYDGDTRRCAVLSARGYTRGSTALKYWFRRFDGSERPPLLQGGYSVRAFQGEGEIEARIAVHRDAFSPSKMTVEKHRAVMHAPTYRQDLDLVVVAPDGALAAYCIVWFDEHNRNGVFEPVGCHSSHRQRGLAKAVIHEGFARLRELGAVSACVMSSGDDEAADRLYRSTGFEVIDMLHGWSKDTTSA